MSRSLGLSTLVVVVAVALCAAIVVASRRHTVETGSVRFLPDEYRFVAPLPIGLLEADGNPVKYDVPVSVRNDTRRSVTLLGGPSYCGPRGCIDLDGFPLTIPSGDVGRISILFRPGEPGPFDTEVIFYTDALGQAEIVLHVTGTALPFATQSAPKPKALKIPGEANR